MIKKKVKKIPKYDIGTISVAPAPSIYNTQASKDFFNLTDEIDLTLNRQNPIQTESFWSNNGGNIMNAATTGLNLAVNSAGRPVTAAGVVNGIGQGAAAGASVGGPWGAVIGGAAGGLLSSIGTGGSVDMNTGEITKPSGIAGLFGHSMGYLHRKSNMVRNSNLSRVQTEKVKADYYNNSNAPTSVNILAAEGGIIRQPVDALVSKGELIYDPETKQLSKVPGSKGKPNKKDDVAVKLHEGDVVVSNSPTMLMANGKTPAQNLENMVTIDKKKNNKLSEGTIKAREAVIKKVVNWQEANKTKPQEYAKFSDGTGEKGVPDLSDMFLYRQKDGKFVLQDINGNRYDVPEMMLPYIQGDERGYWFGPQTGVAPSAGKWNGSMNFAKQMLNSKNVAKFRNTMTRVLPKGAKPANINGPVKPVTGTSPDVLGKPKTAQEAAQMARNERTANMWQQLTSKGSVPQKTLEGPQTWATARGSSNLWENPMALQSGDDIASAINTAYYLNKGLPTALGVSAMLGGAGTFLAYDATKDKRSTAANTATTMPINTDKSTAVMTQEKPVELTIIPAEATTENEKKKAVASKKSSTNKPSSGKKTTASRVTTSTAPSPEDTVVRRPIYEEPVKTVTVPTDDTKVYDRDGRVAYDYTAPEKKVTPQDLGRPVDDNNNYTGSNWQDGLYRMAVLSQPLWDRAEAESIDWTSPIYKYMPTQIDVTSQLRDADQSYALSRYNFANLYPNTGAGMAAGLQAASNRAKRYADIRQWQTNAQNELIGKNVGIYNNWANEHARILNDVYNKSAQNKAAARNINRQNVATALKNRGQIRRDEKLQDVQSSALNMYAPAIKAVMEDPYSVLNPLYNLNR